MAAYRLSHRLSARVELSAEADRLYVAAKNKSEFIREAIENYAHNVAPFRAELREIKDLLRHILDQGLAVQSAVQIQAVSGSLNTAESNQAGQRLEEGLEMTEQEKWVHEQAQFTLGNFLSFGFQGTDEE